MRKKVLFVGLLALLGIAAMCRKPESEETTDTTITKEDTIEQPEAATITVQNKKPSKDRAPAKEYRYIQGCPLSEEIQRGIFEICERYNVSFELVMAVIQLESNFNTTEIGDNGNSIGLMQIQPKWWQGVMNTLGVTDLQDALQNVEVGVYLLASYFEEYDDVYVVLMAYNGGGSYAKKMAAAGKVSEYAITVTEIAHEYTLQNE